MKFKVHMPCPSTCGFVFHAEADGTGSDGVSFWCERRPGSNAESQGSRRYMLAGEGLESNPIATRAYPDPGGDFAEEVELLVQGHAGAVFLQNKKIKLNFRTKPGKGSLAFYNS